MTDARPGGGLHLGIDASNIRLGGGVTHLSQLLAAADPRSAGIDRVTVWTGASTGGALPKQPWLDVRSPAWVEASMLGRVLGQQRSLPQELLAQGCDVLFSPGGTLPRRCPVPTVTMSQNMLPFEPQEAKRFGRFSPMRLKMRLLRTTQGRSFRHADGVIFLTHYARDAVSAAVGGLSARTALIAHGVESRFFRALRTARPLSECSIDKPFRVLYVSIMMPYKHQLEAVRAVARLRAQGVPIVLELIGAPWGPYGASVQAECNRLDPQHAFLQALGAMPFAELHQRYGEADAFLFPSSCENLPNILLEAMAAGLPIASSDRGPMPEVLAEAGVYFDPESDIRIAGALMALAEDAGLRQRLAVAAQARARAYSWGRCAEQTFAFITQVANGAGR